jgi:hypothetical protein
MDSQDPLATTPLTAESLAHQDFPKFKAQLSQIGVNFTAINNMLQVNKPHHLKQKHAKAPP